MRRPVSVAEELSLAAYLARHVPVTLEMRLLQISAILSLASLPASLAITCYQCASTEGNSCPSGANTFTSGKEKLSVIDLIELVITSVYK